MQHEAGISHQLGMLSAADFEEISFHLNRIFGEYWQAANGIAAEALWPFLMQDKKNEDENIGFVFLETIGQVSNRKFITLDELKPLL